MNYDEFNQLCRKSWKEEYNYLRIDKCKKTMEDTVIIMKLKTHKINAFRKLTFFDKINVIYN